MATHPRRCGRRSWRLLLAVPAALTVSGAAAAAAPSLPAGVTLCDGSAPIGDVAAYLLAAPLPYCMNHGTCRDDYATRPEAPCACPAGFAGPHCEFRAAAVPGCTLRCFGGGTCVAGAKSFELLDSPWLAPEDLQYCLCAAGFEGDQCDRQVAPCGTDGESCRHGGTCTAITGLDGSAAEYCDCTTADGAFAGRYCEAEATVLCTEDRADGQSFCTNGGTCKGGAELGCDCPDGFTGPVCEFQSTQATGTECALECFNGGLCRKGAKDISYLERFGIHRRHLTYERFNEDFEHCACPSGFAGRQCEYQMEVCPGRGAVCLHGGTCRLVTDAATGAVTGMGCDCATAETAWARYAGAACEVKSTEFCTFQGQVPVDGPHYDAFCTQGGRCRDVVANGQAHPGCDCPAGTSGDHCEFGEPAAIEPSHKRLAVGFSLAFVLAALLLVVGVVAHRRRQRTSAWYRLHRIARLGAPSFKDCPPPPTMEHIHELHRSRRGRGCHSGAEEGRFVNDLASVSSLGVSESSSAVGFDDDGEYYNNHDPVGGYVPPGAAEAWDHLTFQESLPDGKVILMKAPTGASQVGSDQAHGDPTNLIL